LSSWLGIPHEGTSVRKMHVGFHVKFQILIETGMCGQILVKYPKSNFMKIRSAFIALLHADRQTATHGEANTRIFAKFSCERA
jgi:hypothetical protein